MQYFINRYIYIFLLGGISALDELQFNTGDRGRLSEQLLKSSQGSTIPYMVRLAHYLILLKQNQSLVGPLLSYFLFDLVSNPSVPRVPTVLSIWLRNNIISSPVDIYFRHKLHTLSLTNHIDQIQFDNHDHNILWWYHNSHRDYSIVDRHIDRFHPPSLHKKYQNR